MRLFLSYARVDKPYCIQIARVLHIHEIWYDDRLYAGQRWEQEIRRRLNWCEGFIYLISPDSVASKYCREEYKLAIQEGKYVFPVLIHPETELPLELRDIHYADLSKGLSAEGVTEMLNAIHLAERMIKPTPQPITLPKVIPNTEKLVKLPSDPMAVIGIAADAMEGGRFDEAVFMLKRAIEEGLESRFIDVQALLREAELHLDRQSFQRDMEREYNFIVELTRRKRTLKVGLDAFNAFRHHYPSYDPLNIGELADDQSLRLNGLSINGHHLLDDVRNGNGNILNHTNGNGNGHHVLASNGNGNGNSHSHGYSNGNGHTNGLIKPASNGTAKHSNEGSPRPSRQRIPLLEWCEVPSGLLTTVTGKNGHATRDTLHVDSFYMSKYPVTNAQYQLFLNDLTHGYNNPRWWNFSPFAQAWRAENPHPIASQFRGDERPRENVTWYEAMAFCNWLSEKIGVHVTLPTRQQWQWAAKGNEDRLFPWGNEFDITLANTRESRIRQTTLVMRYPQGVSPFGIYDMAGNVWEWCLNGAYNDQDISTNSSRAVQGGSYISARERAENNFNFVLSPEYHYGSIGFRLACVGR